MKRRKKNKIVAKASDVQRYPMYDESGAVLGFKEMMVVVQKEPRNCMHKLMAQG